MVAITQPTPQQNTNALGIRFDASKVTEGQKEFLNAIRTEIFKHGETLAIRLNKTKVAETLKKSVRTVTRYVKEMEQKGLIETASRRGRNGGTVVVFQKELLDGLTSHPDNALTGTTKKAEELREMMFPNKGTYVPDTRTEEEKARDRILKKKRDDKNFRLNQELLQLRYPTRAFFEKTDDPDLHYRAYMVSRMYNAMLVAFPEAKKNEAEAEGDKDMFKRAQGLVAKFRDYDILRTDFMGTITFHHFMKFVQFLDANKLNAFDYLSAQFDKMFYIAFNYNQVQAPFVNALYGEAAHNRYLDSLNWKKEFEKQHPYYRRQGAIWVDVSNSLISSIQLETQKGLRPLKDTPATLIKEHIQNNFNPIYQDRVLYGFYNQALQAADKADLTESERKELKFFLQKNVALHTDYKGIDNITYLQAFHQELFGITNSIDRDNLRKYYHRVGNVNNHPVMTKLDNSAHVARGYEIHFSAKGSSSALSTLGTMANVNNLDMEWKEVQSALQKIDMDIPLTEFSEIDMNQIYDNYEVFTKGKEEIEREFEAYIYESKKDMEKLTVDNSATYWYNVVEDVVGTSIRDGEGVYTTNE